ncbi:MAG TPA: acetate kinase [Firmicutes bacterium]|nr:acetate kinase [Bacillota bacterium]
MKILCVNAGSSSLKFQLYEMPERKVIIGGYIEKIGEPDSFWNTKVDGKKIRGEKLIKNHTEAVEIVISELIKYKAIESMDEIKGVGHRVLHGGEKYSDSVIITDEVVQSIKDLTKLGPLHHPGNLAGIEAMRKVLPDVPMVAVYDTAFHQTIPEINYIYPVPYEWYEKYGVRRYGFHGTSHKYITKRMQELLGREDINIINCHIGSGSSVCCVKDGKSYDTSMGLTPLDGLMMGTRSGAIDPSIIEYVCKESGMSVEEVTTILNKKSGLLGVSKKYADHRDIEKGMSEGDKLCVLANDLYVDRIARYIAQYYVELNGKVDAITFTAGLGENAREFREEIIGKLGCLGIKVDHDTNMEYAAYCDKQEGIISTSDSTVAVYVVPTDEELMIALDTYNFVK